VDTEYDDAGIDPGIYQRNADRGAQVIQIDSSKHVQAITVCAAICGMSVVFALIAAIVAWNAATEYRVLLNHTMELEAKVTAMEAHYEQR
jgi:mannose/fructose/N-acetylgalactosamine-specific phosphotransferase system component IID